MKEGINPYPQSKIREQMARPVKQAEEESAALLHAAGLSPDTIANPNRVYEGIDKNAFRRNKEIVSEDQDESTGINSLTIGEEMESPVGAAYSQALLNAEVVTITLLDANDPSR